MGSSSQLRLDAAPTANSYLRFDVQGLVGAVNSATLRLFVQTTSSAGFTAHQVADNSWTEGGITFNNAPAIGAAINNSGSVTAGSYVEVDVTSYITGNGLVSLALTTTDTGLIIAQSREGVNQPELVVETTVGGGPTPTPTATASPTAVPPTPTPTATNTPVGPTPTATNTAVPPTPTNTPTATATSGPGGSTFTFTTGDDAIVLSNRPTSNYGAATILSTDDAPDIRSYLKFNVAGLDGSVTSATLRVFVTTAAAPFDVAEVADNGWSQASITYSNAPAAGAVIDGSGAIGSGWVEIDVTSYVNSDGTFSLALLADGVGRNLFDSAETGNGPELVVVTGP
jgi:cell division septation protein DedD